MVFDRHACVRDMRRAGSAVYLPPGRRGVADRVGAFFFFSSRRRHTRFDCDWSSDVCSSDLVGGAAAFGARGGRDRGHCGLPRERHLIGALEVLARRADALVREQARDVLIHRFTLTRLTVPGEWATLPPWRSAS